LSHADAILPAYPFASALVHSNRPGPTGNAITAAGAQKQVERLTVLNDGFRKEFEALLAGRGVLTPEEWNHYAAAIYEVQDALQEARTALQMAARRR
jgi:hypothetical protein